MKQTKAPANPWIPSISPAARRLRAAATALAAAALAFTSACGSGGSGGQSATKGYLHADLVKTPALRSVAKPPPPVETLDPKQLSSTQPENVVVEPAATRSAE